MDTKKKKLFIWDFHGVLEQGNEKAVALISNIVLEEFGYHERMSIDIAVTHYGLKWYQYFELLLPDASHEQCLAIQSTCFERSEASRSLVKSCISATPYAREVLAAIYSSPHDQVLLSNTRQQDLIWYTDAVGLTEYFDVRNIIGVNTHEGDRSKAEVLQELLNRQIYDEVITIGDSAKDIELKKVVGGTAYLYNHPHLNTSSHPLADYCISDLRTVLQSL